VKLDEKQAYSLFISKNGILAFVLTENVYTMVGKMLLELYIAPVKLRPLLFMVAQEPVPHREEMFSPITFNLRLRPK
jgi:hypothetical protein